ncbi:MAG TPA: YihY/virulence factor BrkB family protein [Actinomycetota bacterium]|nr:YihY/virulence factor BrkB family protein [Actinomycetota bacterium]
MNRSPDPVPPQRGHTEPDSPVDLSRRDWKATLKRTLKDVKQDRITLVAAGMAMLWFLAVFPALIAAVGFLGLVEASPALVGGIQDGIRATLPGDAADVLVESVRASQTQSETASGVAAFAGLGLALWGASSGMVAMQTGLNIAYDVPKERKFARARGTAFVLILAVAVLGGIASALLVFGDPIGEAVRGAFPLGDAFLVVWNVIRWVVTVVAIVTLFAVIYYVAPNRANPRWTWVSPGGLVATAIWIAASVGFSLYVSSLGNYAKTYGSLAGVVVLLLWLYLTAVAIMLGGELNAELERQAEHRRRQKAQATVERERPRRST